MPARGYTRFLNKIMLTPATWAQLLPRNAEMMHSAVYLHAVLTCAITMQLVDFQKSLLVGTTAIVCAAIQHLPPDLTNCLLTVLYKKNGYFRKWEWHTTQQGLLPKCISRGFLNYSLYTGIKGW